LILLVGGMAMLLAGCQNPDGTQNNTGSGLLLGGALGALAGAAIGGPRHAGQDALIGAAAGAIAGGVIGNSMDREQEARLRAQAPQTYARINQGQPLSVADVKALAKAGVGDDIIISQIKNSRTIYHLSTADIIDLRDAGVTDQVINYMINTPTTVVAEMPPVEVAPPPTPVDVVVASPGPDYIWVDGEWTWNGGWVWVGGHWMLPPYPHAVWVHGRSWHDGRGWHYDRGYWR
jgi:uncharacterized protein YcfJ